MEAKASRMSQRSNSAAPTRVGKAVSKASITPSQMSERTRLGAIGNRDPLDALSRGGPMVQSRVERRSGLQDVDDEYLKSVVYGFSRQAGQTAAERSKVTADMMPAGVPTSRSPNRVVAGNEGVKPATITGAVPDQIQQQQQPPVVQVPIQQVQQNQLNQQMVTPVQTQKPQPVAPASVPQDAVPQEKMQQPQRQAGGGGGDPELYTTCPNCRATLYLVRNAGDPSPYANQGGDSAQSQAPQALQQ